MQSSVKQIQHHVNRQRVLLIGGGLIGGCMGWHLLETGGYTLDVVECDAGQRQAWDLQLQKEKDAKVVKLYALLDALPQGQTYDWIILALPETEAGIALATLSNMLASQAIYLVDKGVIVTLNSTQGMITHVADRLGMADCHVPVHPLIGSEKRGFIHGISMKVDGETAVLGLRAGQDPLQEHLISVVKCFEEIGFKVITMPLETHDAHFATTSHLSHLLSVMQYALLQSDDEALLPPSALTFTRLAQSDALLWSQLLWHNRQQLVPSLATLSAMINQAIGLLQSENPNALVPLWEQCQSKTLISTWRDEIDKIDASLSQLLSQRMIWSKAIGQHKALQQKPIMDLSREEVVLNRVAQNVPEATSDAVVTVYKHIMAQSRAVQVHG